MKRILVATDGSPDASRAVDTAAKLAAAMGADLVIVTVGGDVSGRELRRLAATGGNLSATLEEAAMRILAQAEKRAARLGISKPKLSSEWGEPAEAIIGAIRREKADVAVAGRRGRGRGRLARLLLGSVSQKMASLAPCTVIVVP